MVNWRSIPRTPRIEVATPTVAAGIPRPPLNLKGRERLDVASSERGVERKRDHKLPNALDQISSYYFVESPYYLP